MTATAIAPRIDAALGDGVADHHCGVADHHCGDPAVAVAGPQRRALPTQLVRFLAVGGVCTATFTMLYLALDQPLGKTLANTVALVVAAVLNTALNRRHTFGRSGREDAWRHHSQGLVILAANWVLSTGSLTGLRVLLPMATHVTELVVLTAANLGGTVLRFTLLRWWVFRA